MLDKTSPLLYPFAQPTRTDFLRIVRGERALVFDDAGNDYVDATSALWFCTVGHGRREIVEAVAKQMGQLAAFHLFERFSNDTTEALAQMLVDQAPMTGARVFLVNSGSEAADSAIKIARAARALAGESERSVIVAVKGAFHGVSYAGISVGGIADNKTGFGPTLNDVRHVAHNDLNALETLLLECGEKVAAVMVEPILGAAGIYPPAPGYLAGVRELCDRYGAWLIFDEVVTGFGRLGTMWASHYFDVRPDLVMFAKGVTSGYVPLGGVFVGPSVRNALESDASYLLRHGHTYSGHPVAAAAALANMEILSKERLLAEVPRIGERLRAGLEELTARNLVESVRGDGAMWALGMHEHVNAVDVREHMISDGRVLVRAIGPRTIAFSPPFVTNDEQIDRCLKSASSALETLV